jgi:hypothetical protein
MLAEVTEAKKLTIRKVTLRSLDVLDKLPSYGDRPQLCSCGTKLGDCQTLIFTMSCSCP